MEYATSHLSWFKHEPLRECVYQENTNDEWNITRLYHEKRLHRNYSGQMERLGVIQLNYTDWWEGSVEDWRMYNGFPDWLYFLWHGIKHSIRRSVQWSHPKAVEMKHLLGIMTPWIPLTPLNTDTPWGKESQPLLLPLVSMRPHLLQSQPRAVAA